jgi:TfoX/Sxy family transcriptional regulator of competence genes
MHTDEILVNMAREMLQYVPTLEEKHMFGGVCFMVNDKMCAGIVKDELMCRIDPEKEAELLHMPGVRPMDFSGKPMKGYLYVACEYLRKPSELKYWLDLCLEFNPKAKASKKKKKED